MPYSGIPANLTAKMDKCVDGIMADAKFKPKAGNTKKQSAVAVCRSRIMPKDGDGDETKQAPIMSSKGFVIHKAQGQRPASTLRAFFTVPRPVRSVEGMSGRYRAYGVLFGDDKHRDVYKQYFTKDTDFHFDWYKSWPWLYSHGRHAAVGAQKVGTWDKFGVDDVGVFIEGELDTAHKYRAAIEILIAENALFPSSRAVADLVRFTADGRITEWPIVEVSTTVTPAEYRMTPVSDAAARAIKSLGGDVMTEEERLAAEAAAAAVASTEPPAPTDGTPAADATAPVADPATPAVGSGNGGDEPGVEAYTLAEVSEAVGKSFSMDKVVDAITLLDATMKSLEGRLGAVESLAEQLGKAETAKVKAILQTGSWYDKLFVASRDATPVVEGGEDGATKEVGSRPLAEGESIWTRLTEQPVS